MGPNCRPIVLTLSFFIMNGEKSEQKDKIANDTAAIFN